MISTFLTLYVASTLMGSSGTPEIPHVIAWNQSSIPEETLIPQKNEQNIEPVITAESAIAVDLQTGFILYEKNIHKPLPIASLTKLMTATVILEENGLDEIATVSRNVTQTPGSKAWLAQGETLTIESLLSAALVGSANDAAVALAEHNSTIPRDFIQKMNQKAKEIGMYSSTFVNPTGLDETPPSSNISTAYDLAILSKYAFSKSFVRRTVIKKELEIESTSGQFTHVIKSTNELLNSYLKVLGLKTGTTETAGECLIAVVETEDGHTILTVLLGSTARYTETKVLTDWVTRAYTWNTPSTAEEEA